MLEITLFVTATSPSFPKGVLLHPCVDTEIKENETTAVSIKINNLNVTTLNSNLSS